MDNTIRNLLLEEKRERFRYNTNSNDHMSLKAGVLLGIQSTWILFILSDIFNNIHSSHPCDFVTPFLFAISSYFLWKVNRPRGDYEVSSVSREFCEDSQSEKDVLDHLIDSIDKSLENNKKILREKEVWFQCACWFSFATFVWFLVWNFDILSI